MKERLIGGSIVGIITLITLFSGGIVTAGILTVVSIIGIYEIMKVYSLEKTPFAIINYIGTVAIYIVLYFQKANFVFPLVIILLILILGVYVFSFPKYKDSDVFRSLFSFIYVTIMLSYVFRIRSIESGMLLCFFLLISSWGNDICAYFVGSAIGKHKFSPKVSPKKSVEGFFGGVFGAALLGVAYGFVFGKQVGLEWWYCAIIAALAAIPAVVGDLAASAIKRDNNIKDYSNLIPGHGGIIDRFDSVIFIAPIIYYLIEVFYLI